MTSGASRLPSLEDALSWFDRAEEHLREFNALFEEVLKVERQRIRASFKIENHATFGLVHSVHPSPDSEPLAPKANVIIGEAIQALRRCLDYLVYEIAFLDSGAPQNDTQFPCDRSPKTFWRRLKRDARGARDHTCYLVGMRKEHAAVIEEEQPYKGLDWLQRLMDLSNPDKHRHLTITRTEGEARIALGLDAPATTDPEDIANGVSFDIPRDDAMYMKFLVTVHVTFDGKSDVVQTLNELKAEVAGVLDEFSPCFDGQCAH